MRKEDEGVRQDRVRKRRTEKGRRKEGKGGSRMKIGKAQVRRRTVRRVGKNWCVEGERRGRPGRLW